MVPLSALFTKATFICIAVNLATAVSDGLSPLMAPSAAVPCPLTPSYGSIMQTHAATDPEQ